jgi:hypothetical protein
MEIRVQKTLIQQTLIFRAYYIPVTSLGLKHSCKQNLQTSHLLQLYILTKGDVHKKIKKQKLV